MAQDLSMLEEFVIEAQEHFETLEDEFLQLLQQKDDPDKELIDKVFRSIHSVKGGAGFLQLSNMSKLAHVMENLLSSVRGGSIPISTHVIDTLIAGVDRLSIMLDDVENSNDVEIEDMHAQLTAIMEGDSCKIPEEGVEVGASTAAPTIPFSVAAEVIKALPTFHKYLYALSFDLKEMERAEGKSPANVLGDLTSSGQIVQARYRTGSCSLDEERDDSLHCDVLLSTMLEPDFVDAAVGLPSERIVAVDKAQALAKGIQPTHGMGSMGMSTAEAAANEEFLDQFVAEADEQMERAENAILEAIKEDADGKEYLGEAYRNIHSFKGNAGLLGLKDFEWLSHKLESVLDSLRERSGPCDDVSGSLVLRCIDALGAGLSRLTAGMGTDIPEAGELVLQLDSLIRTDGRGKRPQAAPPKAVQSAAEAIVAKSAQRRDIRVDLEKLDVLINLVGELVIAESMVTSNTDLKGLELEGFERSAHNLRRIIADLQDVAMAVRMIPLSRSFRKMIRLVHDLSRKAGKKITLELVGEDTEVDKTVIEQIADPLVHIIRNSVDHGLEPPEERIAAGKNETGVITVSARHEGGEVLISVSDDGRGLSRIKILAKAMERGLVTGDGSQLTNDAVFRLIFEPGFSTAAKVTDVSGRGVGMDVVKRNLENLKGRVDVRSKAGKGTEIILRIPLTLAIIDGMLVRVGDSRYTIPLLNIRESFRPEMNLVTRTMDGQEMVRVRDDLIPVVRLHEHYSIRADIEDLDKGILVIVASGPKTVCLFADEIIGHHQTVIKGIPQYIGSAKGISGCTILGDGEVSLILDVGEIISVAESRNT